MSGYVDNRCSQLTVSEVEALEAERDDARGKLRALVEAVAAAEGAYDALDDLVCESSKSIHDSTMWEAEESLGWQEHRNEWYPKMAALKSALKAARGVL